VETAGLLICVPGVRIGNEYLYNSGNLWSRNKVVGLKLDESG